MQKYLVLFLIAMLAVFTGCSSSTDDEKPVDEFAVLVDYLESGDADYQGWVNNLNGWIVKTGGSSACDSTATLSDYFIIDLRGESDFNDMHYPNAYNATLATMMDVIDANNTSNKPILVTCYSGQTAAYGHMLLRLKGYDAYSNMFGMSSYHPSLDKWTPNCSNANAGDFVKTASDPLPDFSDSKPDLDTGFKTGEEILDARIQAAIEAWSTRLVSGQNVIDNAGSYNIMNYWAKGDWDTYGHINGAYQLDPKTLTSDQNLYAFDGSEGAINVLYCWTGQTAAATIAYLYVLGYDVRSIKFGANAMIYDELQAHKWSCWQ